MVGETVHLISDGVVGDIYKNKDILASCGSFKNGLAFSGGMAGKGQRESVIGLVVSLISGIISVLVVVTHTEVVDPIIDFLPKLFGRGKYDQSQRRNRIAGLFKLVVYCMFGSHVISFIGTDLELV